jgi:glutathione S-transferase
MITIYHVPRTRSVRVIWLCEELGIPYELIPVDFSAEYRASPEWRKLNPVGKVPVMVDGDITLFESGAMVEYLLDHYGEGRLRPASGSAEHAAYMQWSWFAEATFARPLGEIVNHRRAFARDDQVPAVVEEMKSRSVLCLDALESALDGSDYLVGDEFSAADIMMGYTLLIADMFKLLSEDHPNVKAYYLRLSQRLGYQRATADAPGR